uniref:Uncharacterized protein n=1 Tax=Ditylenchus dipsaci TaxID=166011 RepID=A0A915DGD2_9BILA
MQPHQNVHIGLWSCYERTLAGEDRTNNFAEATHRRLQTILGIDHPTIGRFIGEMKKAQKLSDYTYEQCIRGQPAPKKRRVYSEADKRILALVELFDQRNLLEYLREHSQFAIRFTIFFCQETEKWNLQTQN